MPKKGGFLTPKAIANRQKAKGLQKLRWYCQMCQKQCRDENGFKCHCTSESHLRQMAIFANNSSKIMDEFSSNFEEEFLTLLNRRFGVRRVHCNIVYNEYISDKDHVHMTSTMWTTLTEFVKYLGREGKCVIDETEKGWYIQYIDRDPKALARAEALAKMRKHEVSEEERRRRHIAKLVAEAQASGDNKQTEYTELKRDDDAPKVKVSFKKRRTGPVAAPVALAGGLDAIDGGSGGGSDRGGATGSGSGTGTDGGAAGRSRKRRWGESGMAAVPSSALPFGAPSSASGRAAATGAQPSALEAIVAEEEARKAREAERVAAAAEAERREAEAERQRRKKRRKAYWLTPGIVVKCLNKTAGGGKFYKKKAVVRKVVDKFGAIIKFVDAKTKLQIDQEELETVIPKPGGRVQVVNGEHRRKQGTVRTIDVDKFCVVVDLDPEASDRGPPQRARIAYEDVCKLAT